MQEQVIIDNTHNGYDSDLTIDIKKILSTVFYRKQIFIKISVCTLILFTVLTFIMPKKYKVDTDLYINKSNNSNLAEVNPFVLDELGAGGIAALMNNNTALNNELQLIQSPLVIDNVIRDNNMVYKKKFGIIPNKKEGEFISTAVFLKKNISFENKKGTNVLTITYKNKDRELAYNVVNSIISHYIALHKDINSEKSKSDKQLLEKEYLKAKEQLENKVKTVNGLPSTAMASAGNFSALSAISSSAQKAMSNLQGQYVAGEKSQLAVKEDAEKVANLSSKLEWAKLVDEMSDSSKVLILKEPQKLRDFEYSSPKFLINLFLGLVLGALASLIAVLFKELTDKNLTYSMLGDEIIYDIEKEFIDLKTILLAAKNEKISLVMFDNIANPIAAELQKFHNINFVKADISDEFEAGVRNCEKTILIAKIGQTDAKLYKQVKQLLERMDKDIITEVLT